MSYYELVQRDQHFQNFKSSTMFYLPMQSLHLVVFSVLKVSGLRDVEEVDQFFPF